MVEKDKLAPNKIKLHVSVAGTLDVGDPTKPMIQIVHINSSKKVDDHSRLIIETHLRVQYANVIFSGDVIEGVKGEFCLIGITPYDVATTNSVLEAYASSTVAEKLWPTATSHINHIIEMFGYSDSNNLKTGENDLANMIASAQQMDRIILNRRPL